MAPIVYISLAYVSGVLAQKIFSLPFIGLLGLLAGVFFAALFSVSSERFKLILLLLVFVVGMASFARCDLAQRTEDREYFPALKKVLVDVPGRILPSPKSDLLGSMIFGSRISPPPEEMREAFRRTGTIHLLVASGLHLSILMGSIMAFSPFLAVFIGLLYVLITGAGPSVIRAFIMAGSALIARCFGRESDSISALSLAALILLLMNPANLFRVGFQLSFAATFALLCAAPVIERRIPDSIPSRLRVILSVSLAPYLFTMPLIFYHFSHVSVVAVLVNALIVPWIGYVIVTGFCSVILGVLLPPLAALFSGVLFAALAVVGSIVSFFSSLPFACFNVRSPSLPLILGYYFGLFCALKPFKDRTIIVLTFACVLAWNAVLLPASILPGSKLEVTVLDVGQGDSIYVETPSRKRVLIDGGEKFFGEKAVLPFLRGKGVNKLDLVVLTHPHGDHVGGLPGILEKIEVDLVLDSGQPHTSNLYKDFLGTIEKNKIKFRIASGGEKIDFGDEVALEILGPNDPLFEGTSSDLNNNSIVMRLIYKDFSMLFMGDAEIEAESRLLEDGRMFSANVLKVGHHGSDTSSSDGLLNMVKPDVAVISVGKRNDFGHPGEAALGRIKSGGTKIFRTDIDGNVAIRSDGERFSVDAGD